MNTKLFISMLLSLFAVTIVSCDDDEQLQDTYKDIIMQVSENTDITGAWWDESLQTECLRVQEFEDGEWKEWKHLGMNEIEGFDYKKGHAYELKVRKTCLANPPADGSMYRYKLLEIISDKEVFPYNPPVELPDEVKFKFKMVELTQLNGLESPLAAPFDFLTFRILDYKGEYSFFNYPKFVEYYDSIVMSSPIMPDTYRVYWKETYGGSAVEEQFTSQWGSYFFEKWDFPIVLKGYKGGEVIYETSDTQLMRERDFLCIDWTEGDITLSKPSNNGIYCVLDRRWEFSIVDTQQLNGTLYTKINAKTQNDAELGDEYPEAHKAALQWLMRKHLGNPTSVALSAFKTLPEGVDVVETYNNSTTRVALVHQHEDDYHLEKYYVIVEKI